MQDAQAPQDFYRQLTRKEKPCDRPIEMLPAGSRPGRPHREIASLSASCAVGFTGLCERHLRERACALGADALLLADAEAGPNPAAPAAQSLMSLSARALRWESQ
jgi:hypothetical protein